MAIKAASKAQKNPRIKTPNKSSLKGTVSEVDVEREVSNNSETGVSVFTKTTSPKVILHSEKLNIAKTNQKNLRMCRLLKSVCLIVLGIVILMTFFLSLKTYHAVNELYQLFNY